MYFAICKPDGSIVTSGKEDKWSDPEKILANYPIGYYVKRSDVSLGKKPEVGKIFGMTWEQIQNKQRKL